MNQNRYILCLTVVTFVGFQGYMLWMNYLENMLVSYIKLGSVGGVWFLHWGLLSSVRGTYASVPSSIFLLKERGGPWIGIEGWGGSVLLISRMSGIYVSIVRTMFSIPPPIWYAHQHTTRGGGTRGERKSPVIIPFSTTI